MSFYPFALQEISVLFELTLGHLRYRLTDVPPQPNSPPDFVFRVAQARAEARKLLNPETNLRDRSHVDGATQRNK